jgi:hypothetical protein
MPGSQCCEHCAEIPELRKEIAELRARLDGQSDTPGDAEDSKPSQAKIEQSPAVQPPRQMVLPRPVDGAPLPKVDQESSTQDKLGLYRTLFAGRSDVYAYRWENAADGTKGWSPKRRPGTTRDNPEHLPLTDDVITAHLTKDSPAACGLYVMLTDSTCRLLICDFDGGTWRLDAAAFAEPPIGIEPMTYALRGGRGVSTDVRRVTCGLVGRAPVPSVSRLIQSRC